MKRGKSMWRTPRLRPSGRQPQGGHRRCRQTFCTSLEFLEDRLPLAASLAGSDSLSLASSDAASATPAFDENEIDVISAAAASSVTDTVPFPDVPNFGGGISWNLNAVNAPEVWAQGFSGEGVIVAVIDTGVDFVHRDLVSSVWVNPDEIAGDGLDNDGNGFIDDIHGWDFVDDDGSPEDEHGHGTHVAGIVASANDGWGSTGIAPDATILAVRVLGSDGIGDNRDIARGIVYAVDQGADILNLSFGGEGSSRVISNALNYALQNDVLIVAAAGNEGEDSPSYPAFHSGALDNVISVGAHDEHGRIADFSNAVGTTRAVQVDAPGVGIFSTLPGNRYGSLSGTSMAAPHVAGLAALTLSAHVNASPAELRELIVSGADAVIRQSDAQGGINGAQTVASAYAVANPAGSNVLSGDINGDGLVDLADFAIVKANFGARDAALEDGDVNGDRVVDLADFTVVKDQLHDTSTGSGVSAIDQFFSEQDLASLQSLAIAYETELENLFG